MGVGGTGVYVAGMDVADGTPSAGVWVRAAGGGVADGAVVRGLDTVGEGGATVGGDVGSDVGEAAATAVDVGTVVGATAPRPQAARTVPNTPKPKPTNLRRDTGCIGLTLSSLYLSSTISPFILPPIYPRSLPIRSSLARVSRISVSVVRGLMQHMRKTTMSLRTVEVRSA